MVCLVFVFWWCVVLFGWFLMVDENGLSRKQLRNNWEIILHLSGSRELDRSLVLELREVS